jgi:hypothetical protein
MMPQYEIKCWNESNFDIEKIPFTKAASEAKKWAFVADYVRVHALFHEGGIYMDTDIKVQHPFDNFLNCSFFSSFENHLKKEELIKYTDKDGNKKDPSLLAIPGCGIMSACMASAPKTSFLEECLDFYNAHSFEHVYSNSLLIPRVLANHAVKYGFKFRDEKQVLADGIIIYRSNVFANHDNYNKDSITIHFCVGSWNNRSLPRFLKYKLYRTMRIVRNKTKNLISRFS